MKKTRQATRLLALSGVAFATAFACADQPSDPFVHVPATTAARSATVGINETAHTNHLIWTGPPQYYEDGGALLTEMPDHGPALFHLFSNQVAGINPNALRSAYGDTGNGAGAVAIVDAFDYPSALNDFNTFSNQFGLPHETSTNRLASSNAVFQVVYATGNQPQGNGGWNQEAALDIEWAHAMAPGAKVYLVEASGTSMYSLLSAVQIASRLPGVRQVSMSWGSSEFSFESMYDTYFSQAGVTFFASAGDTGAITEYPAVSSKVVQVGGTALTLSNGNWSSEVPWTNAGGGVSAYETLPSFQNGLGYTRRVGPDVSAVASPSTGVSVYDSTSYEGHSGWMVFGGTSVSSPVVAGMTNAAQTNRGGSETQWIYSNPRLFHDITRFGTGAHVVDGVTLYSNPAKAGFDDASGWGSPVSTSSL